MPADSLHLRCARLRQHLSLRTPMFHPDAIPGLSPDGVDHKLLRESLQCERVHKSAPASLRCLLSGFIGNPTPGQDILDGSIPFLAGVLEDLVTVIPHQWNR